MLKRALALAALGWILGIPVDDPVAQARMPQRALMTTQQHVTSAALVRGYDQRQIDCLNELIWRESRWNPKARNKRSTASGLFQHLRSPSGVMLADLAVPEQVKRGLDYIDARYGSPCRALAFHSRHNYY